MAIAGAENDLEFANQLTEKGESYFKQDRKLAQVKAPESFISIITRFFFRKSRSKNNDKNRSAREALTSFAKRLQKLAKISALMTSTEANNLPWIIQNWRVKTCRKFRLFPKGKFQKKCTPETRKFLNFFEALKLKP